MDDSEFKPFELTELDSDGSMPVQVVSEDTGFHLLKYDASEDLEGISEPQEKTDEEKILDVPKQLLKFNPNIENNKLILNYDLDATNNNLFYSNRIRKYLILN